MSETVIDAHDIRKSYGKGEGKFDALKGVSLDIKKGESVAIVGKSGSGKSTLMHLLALLDEPDSGIINVAGTKSTGISKKELNKLRNETFGFVFQQFFLTPNASVLDNVMLPLMIAGMPAKQAKARGMEVLDMVQLADKASNKATALSGGQKQRTVIARALSNSPQIIFADEPTGNLDTATSVIIEDILFNLQKEHGITLIIVTHDDDLAVRCDRRIALRDGLIIDPAFLHEPAHLKAPESVLGQNVSNENKEVTA